MGRRQPQADRLEVTGTVLISDLMSCPAVIRVDIGIADGCDNAANDTTEVEVVDVTPPEITVALNRDVPVAAEPQAGRHRGDGHGDRHLHRTRRSC